MRKRLRDWRARTARALVSSKGVKGERTCILSARMEEISESRSDSMIDVFVWATVVCCCVSTSRSPEDEDGVLGPRDVMHVLEYFLYRR